MVRKILTTAALLLSTVSYSKTVLDISKSPRVDIIGVVNMGILSSAEQLLKLAKDHKNITVLVNSPGGSVDAGNLFIQAMEQVRSRGVQLDCVSGVLAASMGFQILAHCDNIFTLRDTLLLFHPIRISGNMTLTASQMEYYSSQINVAEKRMNKDLQDKFKFKSDFFTYHYNLETLHSATELAQHTSVITIVDDIIGADKVLYQYRKPSLLDFLGMSYISPSVLRLIQTLNKEDN